jgi:glyoxylase-like metal-dependent hydrolase (beta-lactamase superfamily II)
MKRSLWLSMLTLFMLCFGGARQAWANPFEYTWHEEAPGVWAAIRQDPFELPQEGNSLFVVTEQGVLLFDAGGSPAMGESILAKVRSVTQKPITHIVISHWHMDHMRGLDTVLRAFPDADVIAHPHTREFLLSVQERWLKRRVSMVPNIKKAAGDALRKNVDFSGRPLIAPERAWIENGLKIVDQLDRENHRTVLAAPNTTVTDRLTFYLGSREIQLIHPANAHTAGDIILWLPHEKLVATGDVVNGPIPLNPSPYVNEYPAVLEQIKGLEFKSLVPGHGPILHDAAYLDLLAETIELAGTQMRKLVAQGLSEADAESKLDLSSVEERFTHGDPFLKNRFQDYVLGAPGLSQAAYAAATGKAPTESF